MFEGFTDRAKRVLEHAGNEATMLQHTHIGTEHLILGLLHEGESGGGSVLQELGFTLSETRRQIDEMVRKARRQPARVSFSEKAKTILVAAQNEPLNSSGYADTEDILLAIVRDGENLGAGLLAKKGVYLAAVRKAMARQETVSPPSGGVFISYRRRDTSHVAGRIADWLTNHLGEDRVFMDIDSIELGADFRRVIEEAIGRCDVLLAVIGRGWLTATNDAGQLALGAPGDVVTAEVQAALTQDVKVIPVLVDGADMPKPDYLPASLGDLVHRNALTIRHESFRQDVNRLLKVIQAMP